MPFDIITLGEALIDLPATQSGVSLTDAPGFTKVPAGAPGNVAAAGAALGLQVAFVSKVGDDPFGRCLIQYFSGLGVDTSHVIQDKAARTGLAFVSVMPDGDRDFLFYFDPARDFALRADELDFDWLGTTRVLHYGSISLIAEPSRSATLAAAVYLKKSGKAVCSYDPNLRPWLWPDSDAMRQGVLLGFEAADIVKISVEELLFLYPAASEEASAIGNLLGDYPNLRLVAVTDGERGCRGYTRGGGIADVSGFEVAFVDATGAGDSFMAGLLAFLLRQGPDLNVTLDAAVGSILPEALRYANACGALATTHLGATPIALTDSAIQGLLGTSK
ncbi:MAG: PfkB family carbohydrate kinase [Janthinobacterium lividum]